jgi:hypothetical protein
MKWIRNVFALTLLLFTSYCIFDWYILVYYTKFDFVKEDTKSIDVLFYEEIFFKIGQTLFLGLTLQIITTLYNKVKKCKKNTTGPA